MNTEFGMKELYDLTLKATYPIEINGRVFETGEVIARFDKIQLANFKEVTSRVTANGGYDNRARVIWEDPKEIQLSFSQGIFSKTQFALLSNSSLLQQTKEEITQIPMHRYLESDETGKIVLGKTQVSNVFVYKADTFERIKDAVIDEEKGEVQIQTSYQDVEVDFCYPYRSKTSLMKVGEKLIEGYLLLEGKTRVKDDITGKTHTAILRIPRLKLISDLSLRLGREAMPVMANFSAIGLPVGQKGSKKIMELLFLDDDIDAEI